MNDKHSPIPDGCYPVVALTETYAAYGYLSESRPYRTRDTYALNLHWGRVMALDGDWKRDPGDLAIFGPPLGRRTPRMRYVVVCHPQIIMRVAPKAAAAWEQSGPNGDEV